MQNAYNTTVAVPMSASLATVPAPATLVAMLAAANPPRARISGCEDVTRDSFGAIAKAPEAAMDNARSLLRRAIATGKLDAEYCDMSQHRRHGWLGWALNYSIYDITDSAVLVQRRETERTKYGISPQKSYFVIRRCGKHGVIVTEASKYRVVKLSAVAVALGQIIDTLEGRAKKPLKQL